MLIGTNVDFLDHLICLCTVNLLSLQLFVSRMVISFDSYIDLRSVSLGLFLACFYVLAKFEARILIK